MRIQNGLATFVKAMFFTKEEMHFFSLQQVVVVVDMISTGRSRKSGGILWLRLNYYTPKMGGLGSNGFHIK